MSNISMQDAELLKYAIEHGMLDTALVQEQIEMQKRKEILEKHPYKIWEGKKGKWYTYIPDDTNGRKLIKRTSRCAIEDEILNTYKKIEVNKQTFKDAYKHWRSVHDVMLSSVNSIYKYNTDYKRYFLGTDFEKKEIESITEEDIKVFICKTTKDKKLCKKSTKTLFGYINNVIYSARVNRIIDGNPMEFLKASQFYQYCTEKERPLEKTIVSKDEMKRLYDIIAQDYNKQPWYIPTYAIEFAILTGMRVSEISALTWDCVRDDYLVN